MRGENNLHGHRWITRTQLLRVAGQRQDNCLTNNGEFPDNSHETVE